MGQSHTWHKRGATAAIIGAVLLAVVVAVGGATAATPPLTFGQVAANQTTKFSGNGFEANEPLALWVTAPDRTVTPLAGDQADASGAFSVTVSFSSDGFWQVTAHGVTTKKEIIGGFTVGNVMTTVVATAGTTTTASATAVAPSQSVSFSRDGFRPLESVALWATGPDSKVTPLDGTSADVNGTVSVPVTFPSSGFWQVTAHGVISGKETIVAYSVSDALTVANSTGVPMNAPPVVPTPLSTVAAAFATSTPPAFMAVNRTSEPRPTARVITGATAVSGGVNGSATLK